MNLLVVDIINQAAGGQRLTCDLVQFERENGRVYLQSVGTPDQADRVELASGDSLVITVQGVSPTNGQSRSQWEGGDLK